MNVALTLACAAGGAIICAALAAIGFTLGVDFERARMKRR